MADTRRLSPQMRAVPRLQATLARPLLGRAPLKRTPLAQPQPLPLLQRRRLGARHPAQTGLRVAASAASAAAAPAPGNEPGTGAGSGGSGGALAALANVATNLFPVWVLAAAVWALARPAAFAWFGKDAITPALAVTMLGMGLTLTFEDFRRVLATPKRIFAGFALQYSIMPLMGYLVSRLSGLPLDYTIGICLVGSCPGGTASNVVTYLARADVTLSVLMTTASTLGAVVATPLLTKLLLGTLVPVDAAALLVSTLQVVLLPVLLGAALNQAFPKAVALLSPLCALSAAVLIALICGSVMAQNAAAVLTAGPALLAALCALHSGGFFFGYAFSKALGMPERAARTNSIEVGMQNSALGALLASVHFPAHPLAAVPCAISACMHSILGSLLAAWWRGQAVDDDEEQAQQPPAAVAAAAAAATGGPAAGGGAAPAGGAAHAAAAVVVAQQAAATPAKAAAAPAAAPPSPAAAAARAETAEEAAGAAEKEEGPVGDKDKAAAEEARRAAAPADVRDFIARWGDRKGIGEAAAAAAEGKEEGGSSSVASAAQQAQLAAAAPAAAEQPAAAAAGDPAAPSTPMPTTVQDAIAWWWQHRTAAGEQAADSEEPSAAAPAAQGSGAGAPPPGSFAARWQQLAGMDGQPSADYDDGGDAAAAGGAQAVAAAGEGAAAGLAKEEEEPSSKGPPASVQAFIDREGEPAGAQSEDECAGTGAEQAAAGAGDVSRARDARARHLWRPDLRCNVD